MRTVSLILSLLLTLALQARAQGSTQQVTSDVRQVLQRQQEAWNRHDLEGFMTGYWNSSELTFFSGARATSGWQPTLDHYRKSYQSEGREMGKLELSDLNIQVLAPDAAFVRGAWKLSLSDGKTPHWLFTLIFRRFFDGWKIVHDHTSAAE